MKNQEKVNEAGKVTRWLLGASIERSALRCSDDELRIDRVPGCSE